MTRQWGSAYEWVRAFLIQRDEEKCYLCGQKICTKHGHSFLIVEHKDNDERNWSQENLGLAHRCCNTAKDPRGPLPRNAPPKSEREYAGSAQWSSEEGKRSSKMVPRYRLLVHHPKTGLMIETGARIALVAFAQKIPDLIGFGSSVTYRRYIEEDIHAGYFRCFEEDGTDMIERTEKPYPLERLGITQNGTA